MLRSCSFVSWNIVTTTQDDHISKNLAPIWATPDHGWGLQDKTRLPKMNQKLATTRTTSSSSVIFRWSSPSTFCRREKEDKVSHSLEESPKQHSTTQGMQIMLLLQNWMSITIISKRRQPNWSTLNSLASQRLQGSQGIYKSLNMICILLIKSDLGVDSSTLLGLCRQEKDDQHNQLRSEKWSSNFSNKFRTN